jgi:ribosomal protein S18 acetylase RimI-like enzyme
MNILFRRAQRTDLPAIVAILADDDLGKQREHPSDPLPETYHTAFMVIDADPNQYLLICQDGNGSEVIGFLQLRFQIGLDRQGAWHAEINAVRIAKSRRNQGIGKKMMEHAISLARSRACRSVALTSDKRRTQAHRFYAQLGFSTTHEGMKLNLG